MGLPPSAAGASSAPPRRFTRFADGRAPEDGYWPLPSDGLCLSSFVLLSPPGRPGEVLVGRLDPAARWDEIGGLDPSRVRHNSGRWMLPSCHLLYFEPPEVAAERILLEQLGLSGVTLGPATVHSESGPPRRHPQHGTHWDIEFLFRGTSPGSEAPRHPAWRELAFVDPSRTPRSEFTRSHDEILELAGFRLPPPEPRPGPAR